MNTVFVIEENVDYEGDYLQTIHATLEGAMRELHRRYAHMAELGTEHLGEMQLTLDKNDQHVKSAYFRFRNGGFYMSEKTLEA